jgi:ferritin-like metal-binding protein YciE
MAQAEQKIVQYLDEALATELALVRVLQSQIAVTPEGTYRSGLEKHLKETRSHAERVGARLKQLGHGGNPVQAVVGLVESLLGQALALGKTPLDLLRGHGGEEKVLKNAKDACATEALEIATYTAIERLASSTGDRQTAQLAASIREDEQRMLDRVMAELPALTDAVRDALGGDGSYDPATTGAAQAAGQAAAKAKSTTGKAAGGAKRAARQTRKVPGVARAEGRAKGAVAGADDLAIARYDSRTAEEVSGRLSGLSQIELAKVGAYERAHENRATITDRVKSLTGKEPWPGYDEQTAAEITTALAGADEARSAKVRSYERSHKDRAGVIKATRSSS